MKNWEIGKQMETINPFLCLDVYKMAHMGLYRPGTTKVYSYLIARSDKKLPNVLWYGLQYYLEKYLTIKPEKWMVDEFLEYHQEIVGGLPSEENIKKLYGLVDLGYFPLEIKSLAEGTVIPTKNVLMTISNTHPDYCWVPGFFESLLLKVWNTSTVASYSLKYKELCKEFATKTCDDENHLPFQVHDFGYRGCSSEETAALSGSAHLINFMGTDTIPAIRLLKHYYDAKAPVGLSVPASEHSCMCSFGKQNEIGAFKHMLKVHPKGIVSIVSDTYDFYNVLTNFTDILREDILNRYGKVVFRPDSGNPEYIICGDPNAAKDSNEGRGALNILWEKFGGTLNSKGYKVLNPKVGLIYGDSFKNVLSNMLEQGFASSNLVIGVGGLLLQQHNRDDQGYAIKATYAEINGVPEDLIKDPVTDPGKKSHTGLLCLTKDVNGNWLTLDKCTPAEENNGLLKQVFLNGQITRKFTFAEVKENSNK